VRDGCEKADFWVERQHPEGVMAKGKRKSL
jgi:hypothetical protein